MQSDLMKKAALFGIVFFAAAMGIMTGLSLKKAAELKKAERLREQEEAARKENEAYTLTFDLGQADTSYLRIPVPEGCSAEDIQVENHYMDRELYVLIPGAGENFYRENAVSGNREEIVQGSFEPEKEGVKLKFQLTGIFEYRTILENNDLYISFLSPGEVYDRIVVIDPACGGMNAGYEQDGIREKDISLQIAAKLKEKLDETDIKVYYTRMDDSNPGEEMRAALANGAKADLYIRIQADASEDSSVYGITTVYNGDFFIPGFGNLELADCLEKEVVTSVSGKALGLMEAEAKEHAVRHVMVPAAAVKAGFLTNQQEAALLVREEYQDKIAEGIYNAIIKVLEQMD
ncbi:MAG: N-acetylmuramoyl-L-alanine amidase [Lachnospiraceae bacterium]|jgi:N-acetylmuramoyl-L-alanine amidase|nr:N-acetylmuramoyl-L-alanine amidase [Lachnospiraceae bacterium]